MRRSYGIFVLLTLILAPFAWLVATTPMAGRRGGIILAGGLIISAALISYAWRSHKQGKLLPNRCSTCGTGMTRLAPGELRPPPGAVKQAASLRWRCRHCGRLA